MKNVAIVGGGIAGLSCLHELRKNDIETELFEAEERVGGRIKTFRHPKTNQTVEIGAGYFHEYYYGLLDLIHYVGLDNKIVPKSEGGMSIVKDGEAILLKPWPMISAVLKGKLKLGDIKSLNYLKSYSKEHCERGCQSLVRFYQNEKGFVETLMEDPWFAQNYHQLFSDFTSALSKNIADYVVRPIIRKQIFQEPEEITSTLGAAVLGSAAVPLKILSGGMETLTKCLYNMHRERIVIGEPVEKVYSDGKKFVVESNKTNAFDVVVFTAPLPKVQSIFTGADGSLDYASTNIFVVEGNLRRWCDKGDSIYVLDNDHGVSGMTRYGKDLFRVVQSTPSGADKKENPRLDRFFSDYDILLKHEWKYALPKHPVHASYPKMHQVENIYLAGDYWFPCVEISIDSGRKVAKQIMNSM